MTTTTTHVRVDSAYLARTDGALTMSSVHPVEDFKPGTPFGPPEYLVRGKWLSGYHVSPTAAPKAAEPAQDADVTVRHLLVTLPYAAKCDPDAVGDLSGSPVGEAMEAIRFAFEDDPFLSDAVSVTQVYPGDVVSAEDLPEPAGATAAPAPATDAPLPDRVHVTATGLLADALRALSVYRLYVDAHSLGRHGMNDLRVLEELRGREGDLSHVGSSGAFARLLAADAHVPTDGSDTDAEWFADVTDELLRANGIAAGE